MPRCLVCRNKIVFNEDDMWHFHEFCSEKCYIQSPEFKYIEKTMEDFLTGLTPLQVSYLDLFIAYDEYNYRKFLSKVKKKCD